MKKLLKNAAEIPTTMFSWLNDTSRPRLAGGAISGDVDRRDEDGRADAEAADHPGDDQGPEAGREPRPRGGHREQQRGGDEDGPAVEAVRERPATALPIIAPRMRQLAVNPTWSEFRSKAFLTGSITPETTALSNPRRNRRGRPRATIGRWTGASDS